MSNNNNDPVLPSSDSGDDAPSEAPDPSLLPKVLQPILNRLPEEEKNQLLHVFSMTTSTHLRTGPLPSSDEYREYEDTRPGSANDIMEMAKKEQDFSHEMGKGQLRNDAFRISVGFTAVVGLVLATLFAIWQDQAVTAGFIAVTAVVATVLRSGSRRKD